MGRIVGSGYLVMICVIIGSNFCFFHLYPYSYRITRNRYQHEATTTTVYNEVTIYRSSELFSGIYIP